MGFVEDDYDIPGPKNQVTPVPAGEEDNSLSADDWNTARNAANDLRDAVQALQGSGLVGAMLFGDGSDGDVVISGDTTLTRNMFYNDLTINNGVTLSPAGYMIYVAGTLTLNGTISQKGANGTASSSANSPGPGANYLGGGGFGGAGNTGIAGTPGTGGASARAVREYDTTSAQGGNQAAGTAGGRGHGGGGGGVTGAAASAANGGSVTIALNGTSDLRTISNLLSGRVFTSTNDSFTGGSGGGGGRALTGSASNIGGQGGCGGGFVWVAAKTLAGSGGLITAAGGNGGAGQNNAGGGGGGGGGLAVLLYGGGTLPSTNVAGGTGGVGAGSGFSGGNGGNGLALVLRA